MVKFITQSFSAQAITLLFSPILAFSQLTVEEHLGMENINNPKVYGSKILYVHTTKDSWDGRTTSSIVLSDTDGKNKMKLTENEYDYDPKWSPRGDFISFVSYRNNLQQVYVIPEHGGEPQKVSDAQAYISNHQWLDNETIVYVDDEPRDSLLVAKEKANGGGYLVGTEFYTNALWSFNINSGEKDKITDGSYRIVEFDISDDSRYLAVIGAKNYDAYESIVHSWVEVINLQSGKSVYKFDKANALTMPKFSPDGARLSFVGSTQGYASNDGLFMVDLKNLKTTNLTFDFDPTIQKTEWLDDESICFSTPRNGYVGIYKVNQKGKIGSLVDPYWVVYDFQLGDDIFFTGSRGSKTNQLYKLALGENPEHALALTHLNSDLAPKIKTASEVIDYGSKDGTKIQGIVTYPINHDKSKSYPLMVIPHGGPDALVMDDFNWMGQYFADNGYVVFQPNFRGSIGYGRDFYAGNKNAFGQVDLEDILAGVERLITLGIADKDKLVIGGWSYGGYMANWAITQTDMFKASISVAGVSNLVSLYGQHEFSNREIGIWEYKALPIDNIDNYRKASPIFFVKNVKTPLLILHGANDSRSPTLQAWEMYRAMKDAGKEVEMMIYPRAGHSIGNPVQFKSVLHNWLNWADRHIDKK